MSDWLMNLLKDDGTLKLLMGFIAAAIIFIALRAKEGAAAARDKKRLDEREAQLKELAHLKDNFQNEVEMARANALSEASQLRTRLAEEAEHRQLLENALLAKEQAEQNRHVDYMTLIKNEEPVEEFVPSEPVHLTATEPEPILVEPVPVVFEATPAPAFIAHVPVVDSAPIVAEVHESVAEIEAQTKHVEVVHHIANDELKAQIDRLSAETAALANALRMPHGSGSWGEMSLRTAVQHAGLVEGIDYKMGHGHPDMTVNLPNSRSIAIDARLPLDVYKDAVNTSDASLRDTKMKAHAALVRRHVETLGASELRRHSDFVVLYIPSEAHFATALEQDRELLDLAARHNVVIANPTTLIAMLRSVSMVAKHDKLNRNAEAIVAAGERLQAGARTFATHVSRLGNNLRQTTESYNEVVGSLDRNILSPVKEVATNGPAPVVPTTVDLHPTEVQRVELLPNLNLASGE